MIVVLLGPPGCGKGTQAECLVKKGFVHISTGDILRAEAASNSELGMQIKDLLKSGNLISDEIVLTLLKKNLDFNTKGRLLLDGFPRTVEQASALEAILSDLDKEIHCVFDFQINEDQLYQRIAGRFVCAKCGAIYHEENHQTNVKDVCDFCHGIEFKKRPDDKKEILSKRLSEFESLTKPLRKYYVTKNKLHVLDAAVSVGQIEKEIFTFLDIME